MRSPRTITPWGLSLVEVVVVIAILGVVMALLLPAVQASREAARAAACRNRLRQIGLAFHHHESQFCQLPTGGWGWRWTGEPDRGFGKEQPGGWVFNILPFIEQARLREMGQGTIDPYKAQTLANAAAVAPAAFNCPSRRPNSGHPFVHPVSYVNMNRPASVARGDYAACSGDVGPDVSRGRGRGPMSLEQGDSPSYVWTETDRAGVVFRRSVVRFADVIDELSSTYLVGEKYVAAAFHSTGTAQNDDQHLLVGYDSDTLRVAAIEFPPVRDTENLDADHSFGSAHPVSFHVAMADGSIHAIAFNVDLELHRARGNRFDGKGGF
jgi:hypothetical protein